MRRTAQDWLVLTALTHNNATAVGIVVALQFAPQVLLLPLTGFAVDHFASTDLDALLKKLGATQVVVVGVATSIGVESTAREAYALGLNVAIATDAVTDPDAAAHENNVTRIFPRLGETSGTADILALLEANQPVRNRPAI